MSPCSGTLRCSEHWEESVYPFHKVGWPKALEETLKQGSAFFCILFQFVLELSMCRKLWVPGWDRFKLKGLGKKSSLLPVSSQGNSLSETSNKVSWTVAKSAHPLLLLLVARRASVISAWLFFCFFLVVRSLCLHLHCRPLLCLCNPALQKLLHTGGAQLPSQTMQSPTLSRGLYHTTQQPGQRQKVFLFGAWPLLFLVGDDISNITNYEQTTYAVFLLSWYCKKDGKKNCFGGEGLVVRGCSMAEYKGQPFYFFFFFHPSFLHLCFHCYLYK